MRSKFKPILASVVIVVLCCLETLVRWIDSVCSFLGCSIGVNLFGQRSGSYMVVVVVAVSHIGLTVDFPFEGKLCIMKPHGGSMQNLKQWIYNSLAFHVVLFVFSPTVGFVWSYANRQLNLTPRFSFDFASIPGSGERWFWYMRMLEENG